MKTAPNCGQEHSNILIAATYDTVGILNVSRSGGNIPYSHTKGIEVFCHILSLLFSRLQIRK